MIQKTYTARMNRVHTMLSRLTAYPDPLEKYGATPKLLESLTLFTANLHQIQAQRWTLKKRSIEATAAKNCNLKKANRLCSRARKRSRP